jgi:hypothetical protein
MSHCAWVSISCCIFLLSVFNTSIFSNCMRCFFGLRIRRLSSHSWGWSILPVALSLGLIINPTWKLSISFIFKYSRNCLSAGAILFLFLFIRSNHFFTSNLFSPTKGIQSAIVAILTKGSIRSYICFFFCLSTISSATARQTLKATVAPHILGKTQSGEIWGFTIAYASGILSNGLWWSVMMTSILFVFA